MPETLRRGSRVGKYRLERRIGQGAFADVWKARDTVENRDVALKLVLPSIIAAQGRTEIEREARIAVRLKHPNIVAVRNADWLDGYFDTAPVLLLIGLVIGFASFTVRLIRFGRWMKGGGSGDSAENEESE